jgi:hypothetical protein
LSIQSDALLSANDVFDVTVQALRENDVRLVWNGPLISVRQDKGCGMGVGFPPPNINDWVMPETLTEVITLRHIEADLAVRLVSPLIRRTDEVVMLSPMRIILSS